MTDIIDGGSSASESREDLLSNLIKAREEEQDGSTVFSDSELMGMHRRFMLISITDHEITGNLFVLLFAGHDTTAQTLAFALGLLAVYPDIQEKLLEQIHQVIAPGQLPVRCTY